MRYIFFTTSYIFFSIKKVFFSKKNFHCNFFFQIKTFFSANNVYFVKNTNIFSKKKIVFNLVLQQLNNHTPGVTMGCLQGEGSNYYKGRTRDYCRN